MTKAEFLHLPAGEQRWILLELLRATAMTVVGTAPALKSQGEIDQAVDVANVALNGVIQRATEEEPHD